jgi:hypothetical protein
VVVVEEEAVVMVMSPPPTPMYLLELAVAGRVSDHPPIHGRGHAGGRAGKAEAHGRHGGNEDLTHLDAP